MTNEIPEELLNDPRFGEIVNVPDDQKIKSVSKRKTIKRIDTPQEAKPVEKRKPDVDLSTRDYESKIKELEKDLDITITFGGEKLVRLRRLCSDQAKTPQQLIEDLIDETLNTSVGRAFITSTSQGMGKKVSGPSRNFGGRF